MRCIRTAGVVEAPRLQPWLIPNLAAQLLSHWQVRLSMMVRRLEKAPRVQKDASLSVEQNPTALTSLEHICFPLEI